MFHMYYKKCISVTSHPLDPLSPVTNCHTFSDSLPSSVTYFMDGPLAEVELQDITTQVNKTSIQFGLMNNAERTKMSVTENFEERQDSFVCTHRHKSAEIYDDNVSIYILT